MSRFCLKSAGSKPPRSHGDSGRVENSPTRSLRQLTPRNKLYAAILFALAGPTYALPEGGQVVAGDASIAVTGDTMNIHQNSQRAILNFHSFDIANQQTVNFHQPGADAVALNRVLGDRLSEIHGALNANGQVYLINPNGVVFGNGAEINVGSLVVTTLDMTDQDFLAGRDAFSGTTDGRVENRGKIDADGRVVLLAPEVINSGEIHVPEGDIVLRASRQALLHAPGSEIPILVEDADLVGRVVNEGTLTSGEVALILDSSNAQLAYDAAINNSGLVRAVRATGEGGDVHLLSGAGIINSGTLDASAETGSGGTVTLEAAAINQSGQINTTAAGAGDGGDITLYATQAIAMHSESTIDASADISGDAGDVVVIAEKSTWLTDDATIKARGGEVSGDGGFVEVSGFEFVSIDGDVDVGASNGEGGLWYIDPTNISIVPDGMGADVGGGFVGSNPATWSPESPHPNSAQINVVTLRNTLNNEGNVLISTASTGSAAGNITFNAVLNYNGVGATRTLRLQADGQIIFTASGGIWDSDPGTADGVNFIATAGTGFVVVDGSDVPGTGVINGGTGRVDITVTTGDALITGLASAVAAPDAIRVRAFDGRIIDNGNKLWDFNVLTAGGGAVLFASEGIENIATVLDTIDAESTTGNISLFEWDSIDVSRLVAGGGDISLSSGMTNLDMNGNYVGGVGDGHIELGTVVAAGDANFLAQNGNLTVTAQPTVSGSLGLVTTEAGNVIIPTSAFVQTGGLIIDANDLLDTNRTLTMEGTDASITLRNAGGAHNWTTRFDSLAVQISGQTLQVQDENDLRLTSLNSNRDVTITTAAGGDLVIDDIRLGGNGAVLNFTSGGALTHNGTLTSAAAVDNITFNFNSATALNLNGSLRDSNNTSSSTHTFNFSAGTDFVMAADAEVGAGDGEIAITATTGDATITGLSTVSDASDAVRIYALNGAISSANPTGKDIDVPDGGFLLHAMGDIGDLQVESNFFDVVSATGDITFHEEASTSALRLESPGLVSIYTGGQLSLDQAATFSVNDFYVDAGGDFRIADTGLMIDGDLTVTANNIRGGASTVGNTVTLAAADANITLRNDANRTWTTSFDELALTLAGGNFSLTDTDGLTISSFSSGGNASLTTTGADLELTSALTVAGNLSLITSGSGNVVIPETGWIHTGNLTLDADDLRDSDADVIFGANSATITLRDGGTQARSWITTFDELVLEIAGTGDFSLANTQALVLTSVTTGDGDAHFSADGDLTFNAGTIGGNASFTANDGNVVLAGIPTITGDLTLTTVGSGDVVLPNTGVSIDGNLIVDADELRDSDSTITLAATNADITLRGNADRVWTTTFDELALSVAGGDFSLTDTDGLILTALSGAGNASITTTDADLVVSTSPTLTGDLSLITDGSGDVVVPDTGLAIGGDLLVDADDLQSGSADVILGAANATITLRDGVTQARSWITTFDELVLEIAGIGDFSLANTQALVLTSVTTGGNASFTSDGNLTFTAGTIGGDAAFTANEGDILLTDAPTITGDLALTTVGSGDVILPGGGINISGDLTVDADDLRDDDTDLTLAAANATITIRGGGTEARVWNTTFDQLVLDLTGTGDFNLTDTDALILTSITTSGGNASFTTDGDLTLSAGTIGGNAAFTANDGDVVLTNSPGVAGDLTLTTVGSGDVIVPNAGVDIGGDLLVDADDLQSGSADVILGAANATITLRDGGAQARSWITTFDELVLEIAGAGDFSLANTQGLVLTSVTTGGNASFAADNGNLTISAADIGGDADFIATNGDVELTAAPTVAGNVNLTTIGSGDVIIPDAGLDVTGDLTVLADELRSNTSPITLAAVNADINLRGGAQPQMWNTSFDALTLFIGGAGDISVTDTDALTLTSVTTGGNATFRSTDGDLVLTDDLLVDGDLTLATVGSGDLVLTASGLNHAGDLFIDVDSLAGGGASLDLAAANADINLREDSFGPVWNTNFDELILNIAGGGDFRLVDEDGLTLTSVTIGGNASFSATDGNLVVGSLDVAGDLSLIADGSGDVVIPDSGLFHDGNLTVEADNLLDSDSDITLGALNADITLRDGALASSWITSFDQLILDIAGAGDFVLTDTDGLELVSVITGGSAVFSTTDADLVLGSFIEVGGGLSLATIGSGDLIIPDSGLMHNTELTIDVDNIASSASEVMLGATSAGITLRGGDLATSWITSFDELALQIDGDGDFQLADSDGLTLNSVTTGGSASFTTTGGDLVFTDSPTVGGELTLETIGPADVVIPDAGLLHNGSLNINAANLRGADSGLILGAAIADIRLRDGTLAQAWITSFDTLILDIAGGGAISVTDTDALTLGPVVAGGDASFSSTNGDLIVADDLDVAGALTLIADESGDVIIPENGLLHGGSLTIVADNLADTDSTVTLSATNADITLRDGSLAHTWSTRFDQLIVDIAGSGALSLTEEDGLTLTSVTTGGDASFRTNDADLVLQATPNVAGALSLTTVGSGDVVIPSTGLVHTGDLRILADDLMGNSPIRLSAAEADIHLRGGSLAQSWLADFDQLTLNIEGDGNFSLTDFDGLTLASIMTGGNASFTATGADLTVVSAPQVAGDLRLATSGSGTLIIPDAGLTHAGNLTLIADRVLADDADIRLSAARITTTLRNQQQAANWQTLTNRISLNLTGGGTFNLSDTGPLVVEDIVSDGVVNITTDGSLQIGSLTGTTDMTFSAVDVDLLQTNYNVGGELSLSALDQLQLAAAGLTVPGALQLSAAGLSAAGGGPVILAANSADLTLTGDQALALTTRLGQLGLTYGGEALSINNDRNLLLPRFDVPNLANLSLTVNGTLTVPSVGLAASQRINIDAVDLLDGDRSLSMSAPELAVRLSNAGGDHTWAVNSDVLDVLLRGQADLSVSAADGLRLADLNGDSQAVLLENGNFSLALSSGDLIVAGNVSAADLTADGERAGVIDLTVAQGNVMTAGPVTLLSSNTVDQTAGAAGEAYGIRIRLTDTGASTRNISLGDETGGATLRAIGGDVLLDTRPAGTAADAARTLVHTSNSIIEVYNSPGDARTGQVFVNGLLVPAQPWQTVRQNRLLAIVSDVAAQDPGNVLDELDDLDGSTDIVTDVDKSGPQAAYQFEQVFGTCDELDQKNQHRCRVDAALKSFLAHWLVGGEMPPKTEIHR